MALFHNYHVYILRCSDNSYYTGVTSDLEGRLYDHQNGTYEKAYTFTRRPVKLMYAGHFTDINLLASLNSKLKDGVGKRRKHYSKKIGEKL